MKTEISPALATVVVVIVVLAVGLFLWARTSGAGHSALTPEQRAKMQAALGGTGSGAPMNSQFSRFGRPAGRR